MEEMTMNPSTFHETNTFASDVEELSRLSARAENVKDNKIAIMFSEVMSDNESKTEQNTEIWTMPEPSRASTDSANPMRPSNNWPPPDATKDELEKCPNSNKKQASNWTGHN